MTKELLSRSNILSRIGFIASDILNISDLLITEDTMASDVPGWDSLTHVQIVIAVETAFNIRMTATEVAQLENVGSLIDIVEAHQWKAASA